VPGASRDVVSQPTRAQPTRPASPSEAMTPKEALDDDRIDLVTSARSAAAAPAA
jgi:hypothetical protein